MIYNYTIKGKIYAENEEDAFDILYYKIRDNKTDFKTIQINDIVEIKI